MSVLGEKRGMRYDLALELGDLRCRDGAGCSGALRCGCGCGSGGNEAEVEEMVYVMVGECLCMF